MVMAFDSSDSHPIQSGTDSLDISDILAFPTADSSGDPIPCAPLSRPLSDFIPPDTMASESNCQINALEPQRADGIEKIRERLFSMGIVDPPAFNSKVSVTTSIDIGQRERELAEMVVALTNPVLHPLPSQVIAQANTIAQLTNQIEVLVEQHSQRRQFWEAEKENWLQIARALTTRPFTEISHREEVLERDNQKLKSENRALQLKLQDQETRIEDLEADLRTLKPLLLLRSAALPKAEPSAPRPVGRPRRLKEKEGDAFSDDELGLHHSTKRHNPTKSTTTADARSEHILLATRKLGKEKIASLLPSAVLSRSSCGSLGNLAPQSNPYLAPPTKSNVPPPRIANRRISAPAPLPRTQTAVPAPFTVQITSRPKRRVGRPAGPNSLRRPSPPPQHSSATLLPAFVPVNAPRVLRPSPEQNRAGRASVDGSPLKPRKKRRVEVRSNYIMSALDVLAEQAVIQSPKKGVRPNRDVESADEMNTATESAGILGGDGFDGSGKPATSASLKSPITIRTSLSSE